MALPPFQNPRWLQQALTHSSYAYERPDQGPDYERLEFLGDSILEFVVRDLLFARYPRMTEGEMSKRSDRLVDQACLAALAVELGIPAQLRLGAGAQTERQNPSVLADALEAVIGAYRLDAGREAAYDYVAHLLSPLVDQVATLPITDPISQLQEFCQAQPDSPPLEYRLRQATGPDHARRFTVEVWLADQPYGSGQGRSKKEARKQAALATLQQLQFTSPVPLTQAIEPRAETEEH